MIQVTFTFSSKEEAAAFLGGNIRPAEVLSAVEAEPKKKAGRPKKEDQTATEIGLAPSSAATPPSAAPKADPGVKYTMENCREALQKVVGKIGLDAGTAFVKGQGYARISAIPAEKMGEFVAACEAKIAE